VGVDVSNLLVDNAVNTLSLCHFALEASQRTITYLIVSKIIVRNVEFTARVAFDSAAIIHIINSLQVCHRGISISLPYCGLRDKQLTALLDALVNEHRNLQVDYIDLRGNRLTDESLAVLFERASPAFSQSLRSVNVSNNKVGPKTVNSLTSVLAKSFSVIAQPSTPFDFVDNCTQLDISDCPLGVDGCKALRNALCANKLACLKCLSLAGSLTSDADTNAELILAFGSGHQCSLESLDLSRNDLGAPGGKALEEISSDPIPWLDLHPGSCHLYRLEWLDLSRNILGAPGGKALEEISSDPIPWLDLHPGSCHLYSLEWLDLSRNIVGAPGGKTLEEISSDLHPGSGHLCSLELLDLSRNTCNLGAPGGKALGKILSDLHLHTLILTETMFGDEGVAAFIKSLTEGLYMHNNLKDAVLHELRDLYMDNNGIQAAGISCLAKSVCTGILKLKYGYFTLANNPLGLEGVIDVVKMLTSDHFQAYIDLSGCQLTTAGGSATNHDCNAVGVQQLICSQQLQATHSNLMTLVVDNNNFSGEGIHILATFIYTCQENVYDLSCRGCGITSNDLKQLLVLLSELKLTLLYLDSWDLGDNDIDDDGVSALIQHLSIFPRLSFTTLDGNIRISPGMLTTLKGQLKSQEVH
jgi:Ran GTPase-activating protein (RanGAP) involved in mRNA processing and transport